MRATWFTLAVLTVSAVTAVAGPVLWIDDAGGNLAKVDVTTGVVTPVGNFGAGIILDDIAFDPTGKLWGIANSTGLYSINTLTGAATFVAPDSAHVNFLNSLVFASNGTLYSANNQLFTVNTTNGNLTAVGGLLTPGGTLFSQGDIAFLNGNMYLTVSDGTPGTHGSLVTINQATGVATVVGPLSGPANGLVDMFGLASAGGVLYGVSGTTIYTVNPLTGALSNPVDYSLNASDYGNPPFPGGVAPQLLGKANGTTFFAEAQVPEPTTFVLLGGGLLALGFLRKRTPRA